MEASEMTAATKAAADLSGYSESAQRAIRSEAEVWRYGDVESARRSFDKLVTWAEGLTAGDLALHSSGAWYASDLLKLAACSQVRKAQDWRTVVWRSPEGTDHIVNLEPGGVPGHAHGKCATCGRTHNAGHALTVARFGSTYRPGHCIPCEVVAGDWPYPCDAQKRYPDHVVYTCTVHSVWWHESA